jgi:hypothetical protein
VLGIREVNFTSSCTWGPGAQGRRDCGRRRNAAGSGSLPASERRGTALRREKRLPSGAEPVDAEDDVCRGGRGISVGRDDGRPLLNAWATAGMTSPRSVCRSWSEELRQVGPARHSRRRTEAHRPRSTSAAAEYLGEIVRGEHLV